MGAISSFRELMVRQEAHKLVLMIYQTTGAFPANEQYGLVSQMRRATVSIPANIVEGYKRRGWQEKVRFYNIAEASLEELKYYLLLSTELEYLNQPLPIEAQADTVGRLLFRFIESALQNRDRHRPPNP